MIDEDAAHDTSRDRKKMRPVLPFDARPFNQPEIHLVDECSCLKAVTRGFSRHAAPRDLVEFLMDERNQPLEGILVAPRPFEKEPGDSGGLQRNAQS